MVIVKAIAQTDGQTRVCVVLCAIGSSLESPWKGLTPPPSGNSCLKEPRLYQSVHLCFMNHA
jgi:hypothetical protein